MNDRPKSRSGIARPLLALVIALVIGYLISPYISFWFFTRAVRANDVPAIERYVDFPAVRASLKEQLHGYLPKDKNRKKDNFSGLVARIGPTLIDQLVDSFVTPEGLSAILTDPAVTRGLKAKDANAIPRTGAAERHEINFSRVHYAFFTSPRMFLVDFEQKKLYLRFAGWRWRLKRIELPPNE